MAAERKTVDLSATTETKVVLTEPFTRLEIKKTSNDAAVVYARADGTDAASKGDECVAIAGGMGAYDFVTCKPGTTQVSVYATLACTITVSRA